MAQLLDLPTELQIKILNNLDLKTLMQCKTVSLAICVATKHSPTVRFPVAIPILQFHHYR